MVMGYSFNTHNSVVPFRFSLWLWYVHTGSSDWSHEMVLVPINCLENHTFSRNKQFEIQEHPLVDSFDSNLHWLWLNFAQWLTLQTTTEFLLDGYSYRPSRPNSKKFSDIIIIITSFAPTQITNLGSEAKLWSRSKQTPWNHGIIHLSRIRKHFPYPFTSVLYWELFPKFQNYTRNCL